MRRRDCTEVERRGLSPGQILETLRRGVSRAWSSTGAVDVDVDVFTHALYVPLPATEDTVIISSGLGGSGVN